MIDPSTQAAISGIVFAVVLGAIAWGLVLYMLARVLHG